MNKAVTALVSVLAGLLLIAAIFFSATPGGRAAWNSWTFSLQKADDATSYGTIKTVEDTCRAYMASYEADRQRYEQYRDSDSEEQRSWGEQAKIRANSTASTYNNYILQNSFVWSGNVPADIKRELEYLE